MSNIKVTVQDGNNIDVVVSPRGSQTIKIDRGISSGGSGVTSVTGTAPISSSGGTAPDISISQASASSDGYLSSTDWNTFNNKGSGTVTSVTATSPVASTGGTTPVISMPAATTSTSGYLTSTDWNTFNNKQPAGSYLTTVTADSPLTGSGTSASHLSIPAATTSVSGYLTSTDWNTFNNKGSGTVTAVSVVSANGLAGTSSGGATPALTLSTTVSGLLKGNGTAISAATSGTDYAPATSGNSILYGNGAGGFNNASIGTGLGFTAGNLSLSNTAVTANTYGSATAVPVIAVNAQGQITAATNTNIAIAANQVTTGTMAINRGGTAGNATPTAGAIAYGTGTAYAFTVAGTAGQVLTSNGSGVPTWTNAAAGTVTSVTATAPVQSTGGTAPVISMAAANTTTNGYLTSTDWNTFNSKQTALVSGTNIKTVNGSTLLGSGNLSVGTVTSVGLSMPPAFSVANSPVTNASTLTVTAAGTSTQYIRGDGQLADFPTNPSAGGAISFYLNGGTAASVGGYYQMSSSAVIGTGVDFTASADGYISQWLTDVGSPNQLQIPAGNWNFELYMSASSVGGNPYYYIEILKYNGSTFTAIANSSANPEYITGGTSVDLYYTSVAVPQTTLLATDRLAIRVYVSVSGRTITMHTQDSHLCQIITNFPNGIASLNGLTASTQYLAVGSSGTDFAISSATDTHTFNLPTASASARGALSSGDWSTFNGKQAALVSGTNIKTVNGNTLLGAGDLSVGTVTSVTATSPVASTGGTTPVISMPAATTSVSGYLTSTDWNTFNNKGSGTITGSGTTNYITKFSSSTAIGNSVIYDDGTNIGVGTASPAAKLDVSGAVKTTGGVLPRAASNANQTSPWAWSSDSYDQQSITALANALTINADSGSPTDGQKTTFRIKDNGTARALTWTTGATKAFRAIGVTLPTTTVISKTVYVGCIYNAADSRWDVVAVAQEA